METLTTQKILVFATLLSLLFSFFSTLYSAISAKAAAANVQHPGLRKTLVFSSWLVTACFIITTISFIVISNPPVTAAFNRDSATTSPSPCPAPVAVQADAQPSPVNKKLPDPIAVPAHNETESFTGTHFLVKGIKLSSPNALMADFAGTYTAQEGGTKVIIPKPDLRLASEADIWGARNITGGEVIIGEYAELAKIAGGKAGIAEWRGTFELNEVRDHGQQFPTKQPIEVYVAELTPRDLSNKAILFKLDNKLVSSGKKLTPAYSLSERRVF